MNTKFFTAIFLLFPICAFADGMKAAVNLVDASGIGKPIGSVVFSEVNDGVQVKVDIHDLPPGEHGFHIHENPSCEPGEKDGKKQAAIAAGGHYDPAHTGKHLGPRGEGHRGDMPALNANKSGVAKEIFVLNRIKLWELKDRSVVVHEHGDNFMDTPKPLGGGGARIACGVIGLTNK